MKEMCELKDYMQMGKTCESCVQRQLSDQNSLEAKSQYATWLRCKVLKYT